MKKYKVFLAIFLCLLLAGCSNDYAKQAYASDEKIAKVEDRFSAKSSVFNKIEGGYALVVSQFDGRKTLWKDTVKENQEVEIELSLTLTKGTAKIVHVDAAGNVTTLVECTPETAVDASITKTASLQSGSNSFKLVAYDAENIDLKMLFTVGESA